MGLLRPKCHGLTHPPYVLPHLVLRYCFAEQVGAWAPSFYVLNFMLEWCFIYPNLFSRISPEDRFRSVAI